MRLRSNPSRKLALLAPSGSRVPEFFRKVHLDSRRSEDLLAEAQRLRGVIYLRDGAIGPADLVDGRHQLDIDQESWHLLVLDKADRVCGGVRYRERSNKTSFSQLAISKSALARCDVWGPTLQDAVGAELALSRQLNLSYVEVGGWALIEQIRGTTEAFRMAMAMFALSQVLGGAVGISTATHRNGSASILRRIGGRPLDYAGQELPPYDDASYGCKMEILRFWSWAPNARFRVSIDDIRAELRNTLVLTQGAPKLPWLNSPYFRPANELCNAASAS